MRERFLKVNDRQFHTTSPPPPGAPRQGHSMSSTVITHHSSVITYLHPNLTHRFWCFPSFRLPNCQHPLTVDHYVNIRHFKTDSVYKKYIRKSYSWIHDRPSGILDAQNSFHRTAGTELRVRVSNIAHLQGPLWSNGSDKSGILLQPWKLLFSQQMLMPDGDYK